MPSWIDVPNISDHDLPNSMHDLKKKLEQLSIKKKSLHEYVHDSNNKANTLLFIVNNIFSIIDSSLSGLKNIPVPLVGFVMDMVAVIPQSGAILTDPKKSIPEKIIAASIIGGMSALTITIFVVGGAAAAIISAVISCVGAIIEGSSLFGLSTQKYTTAKAYQLKKEFDALIEQKNIPQSAQYNELFEVRAVELWHQITQPWLKRSERQQIEDELEFIDKVLNEKKLLVGANQKGAAAHLIALYKERDDKMADLVTAATKIDSGNHSVANNVSQIKDEVIALDARIKEITASKEHLKAISSDLNSTLAHTSTNLVLSGVGFAFSIIGVLLTVGVFIAPPLLLSVMIGIGIAVSVIGLLKWGAEKYGEYHRDKQASAKLVQQENSILNETLTHYACQKNPEHSLQSGQDPLQQLFVLKERSIIQTAKEEPIAIVTETETINFKEQLRAIREEADSKVAPSHEEPKERACNP